MMGSNRCVASSGVGKLAEALWHVYTLGWRGLPQTAVCVMRTADMPATEVEVQHSWSLPKCTGKCRR